MNGWAFELQSRSTGSACYHRVTDQKSKCPNSADVNSAMIAARMGLLKFEGYSSSSAHLSATGLIVMRDHTVLPSVRSNVRNNSKKPKKSCFCEF